MEKDQKHNVSVETTSHEDATSGPPPVDYNPETGQRLWIIKDYKIWAQDYRHALDVLSLIEQSLYDVDNQ